MGKKQEKKQKGKEADVLGMAGGVKKQQAMEGQKKAKDFMDDIFGKAKADRAAAAPLEAAAAALRDDEARTTASHFLFNIKLYFILDTFIQ